MAFVLLFAVVSGRAMAAAKATPCATKVIADWYDDGRVGKIYPLECYRQAIASLQPDVLDYSNAKEEIGRALAFAKQGQPDPGGNDPTPPTVPVGTDTTDTNTSTDKPKTDTSGVDTSADTETTRTDTQTTDTSGPSSVPIPLVVLGGLAVLLLAAGSAGYLRRRMNGDEDGDGTPPASA
jgi:Alphavirus glycoprotein J